MVTQQNYTSVLEELERSRHTVRRLEEEKDMERERCAQAIAELQAQLRVAKETNKCQVREGGVGKEWKRGWGGGEWKGGGERCV